MTYKIERAALWQSQPDAFALLVSAYVGDMNAYEAHMARVKADADLPDDDINKHQPYPAPDASADVRAAIRVDEKPDGSREYVADYEIIEPPGPTFEQKKLALFQRVSEAEHDAISAIVPPGKVRLHQIREADIRAAEHQRVMALAMAMRTSADAVDEPMSAESTQFLAEQEARAKAQDIVHRHAAQLLSDIEDLTPETIDSWEMKPFNG